MAENPDLIFLNFAKAVAEKKVGTWKDVLAYAVLNKLTGDCALGADELIAELEFQRDCHTDGFSDLPFQEAIDKINKHADVVDWSLT